MQFSVDREGGDSLLRTVVDLVLARDECSVHDIRALPALRRISMERLCKALQNASHRGLIVRCGDDRRHPSHPVGMYRAPNETDIPGYLTSHLQPMLCGAAA